ncbi:hypothetical protein MCY_01548 [Bartonella rattimassiliensis 15908]|uniref:Uncharacterized protein n=1 Tax=Bartonella rattimassiliensis 15908 TaxID=1094556 RepID=J1JEX2_9HYPH|nr:hypothetical protein MCY_01548 [Bartonella rattimassiliensis 15908]
MANGFLSLSFYIFSQMNDGFPFLKILQWHKYLYSNWSIKAKMICRRKFVLIFILNMLMY